MIAVAGWKGLPAINAVEALPTAGDDEGGSPASDTAFTAGDLFKVLASAAAIGAVLSAIYIQFLIRNAKALITCTVYTAIAVNIIAAIVCAAFIAWPFALPWLVLAALSACFWYLMRRHIPFAAANLSIAAKAVSRGWGTIVCAYITLAFTVVWVVVWSIAALGSIYALEQDDMPQNGPAAAMDLTKLSFMRYRAPTDDDNGAVEPDGMTGAQFGGVIFLLLISFYWGIQVLRNTLHVVTAGTVGTWWATAHGGDPTWGSARRALTTSFGSIALGSLIIAVIQAIRAMAEGARNQARHRGNLAVACCAALAVCLIRLLEDVMRYFTSYAFCQVALYGTSFWESGRNAFVLFTRRGWTAVFNDTIIDRALFIGALLFGALCGGFSALVARLFIADGLPEDKNVASGIAAAFGFVVGFFMCAIVAGVIESAVKTVFVCFAERPEALLSSHPEDFATILSAWWKLRPELVRDAGYDRQFSVGGPDYA